MARDGFIGRGDFLPAVPDKIKPREVNPTVHRTDANGVFNINTDERSSIFGPVVCPKCQRHMSTARESVGGRGWILRCPKGHRKTEISFASF